jgi:hypothetical protein
MGSGQHLGGAGRRRSLSELVKHFSYVLGDKYCRDRKESNYFNY